MAFAGNPDKFLCKPCKKRGKETEARTLCYDCHEPFCEECSTSHLSFDVLKDHRLIELVPYFSKLQLQPSTFTETTSAEKEILKEIRLSEDTVLFRTAQAAIPKEKKNPTAIKATKCLEFSVNTSKHGKVEGLIGAIYVSECIVVFDINNLNLFDRVGNFLSSTKLIAETRGITSVGKSSFATCGYGNKVYSWTVKEDSIINDGVSYNVDHVAHGIHFNGTYFSVLHSVANSISILSRQGGKVSKITMEEALGKKIKFGWDIYMESETHNVYVPCDKDDGVLCVTIKGDALWFTSLESARCITEIRGSLCVTDVMNACLHLISKDGGYVRKLLDEKNLRGTPYSVSFSNNDRLCITYQSPSDRRHVIIIFSVTFQ